MNTQCVLCPLLFYFNQSRLCTSKFFLLSDNIFLHMCPQFTLSTFIFVKGYFLLAPSLISPYILWASYPICKRPFSEFSSSLRLFVLLPEMQMWQGTGLAFVVHSNIISQVNTCLGNKEPAHLTLVTNNQLHFFFFLIIFNNII